MSLLRIGQKVTQAKPIKWPAYYGEAVPSFGAVYTVREITEYLGCNFLKFSEIRNPVLPYRDFTGEMDFLASVFRPIVDKATDISFAHEILRKASLPAPIVLAPSSQ